MSVSQTREQDGLRGAASNAATEQLALEHLEHEQQAKRDHEEPGHKPHISG
jgi:hypothetical protein